MAIPTGTTIMGTLNVGEVATDHDCRRIAGYRSMTGGVQTTSATVRRAVYCTHGDASVNLCQHARPQRREMNRTIYLYAEVNLKRNLHYCWSYWQTRSIAWPLCDSSATCESGYQLGEMILPAHLWWSWYYNHWCLGVCLFNCLCVHLSQTRLSLSTKLGRHGNGWSSRSH